MFELGGVTATVESSLLWMLQEDGWLSPYFNTWVWQVRADDARLGRP